MKSKLLLLIFFILTYASFAQTGTKKDESWGDYVDRKAKEFDHLEPADSYFDYFQYRVEYHNKIRSFLLDTLNTRPLVIMLVLASFSNEYVINLEKLEGAYLVTKVTTDKSIWYTENPEEINVIASTHYISKNLADQVNELFEIALNQTKYNNDGILGTDGTNYYFTATGNFGRRTSSKWSPRKGTKIYELVRLTELLVSENLDEKKLTIEIQKLKNRF